MRYTLFIIITLTLFSCKKRSSPVNTNIGLNYFQLAEGDWRIYDVDSIVHDDNDDLQGLIDTFRYQIKEVIDSSFIDLEGELSFRVERYKRNTESDNWKIKDVWYAKTNSYRVETVEENKRYIKLTFPVNIGEVWNGNALNNDFEWEYEYTDVDIRTEINGNSFDSVLTVLQRDENFIIETEYAEERYARNVGMIYKNYTFIDIQNQSGVEYIEQINSFDVQ